MQKWAYEIHSSFIVPGAPLRLPNIEQAVVNDIDRLNRLSTWERAWQINLFIFQGAFRGL